MYMYIVNPLLKFKRVYFCLLIVSFCFYIQIANIGPADYNSDETLSTLRYADTAKRIKNKARINEDPKDAMLREFQKEIEKLKKMLAEEDREKEEEEEEEGEESKRRGGTRNKKKKKQDGEEGREGESILESVKCLKTNFFRFCSCKFHIFYDSPFLLHFLIHNTLYMLLEILS